MHLVVGREARLEAGGRRGERADRLRDPRDVDPRRLAARAPPAATPAASHSSQRRSNGSSLSALFVSGGLVEPAVPTADGGGGPKPARARQPSRTIPATPGPVVDERREELHLGDRLVERGDERLDDRDGAVARAEIAPGLEGWLAASRSVAPRTVSSSRRARTIERGTLRTARRRSTSAGAVYSGFQAVTTRVSTWPASISWASRARRPDPGSESTSGLGRKTTVLPTFPSASLTAAARAWTAGGWRSPATTTTVPRDPARSLATAAAAFARAPSAGAPSGASCGEPVARASSAATARANPGPPPRASGSGGRPCRR